MIQFELKLAQTMWQTHALSQSVTCTRVIHLEFCGGYKANGMMQSLIRGIIASEFSLQFDLLGSARLQVSNHLDIRLLSISVKHSLVFGSRSPDACTFAVQSLDGISM